MSLKTRIIVLLSLLFALVACLLFPRKNVVVLVPATAVVRPALLMPNVDQLPLLASESKLVASNHFLRPPGQKFKQLKNTDRSLSDLIQDPKAVLLRNASIDTRVSTPLSIPLDLQSKPGSSSSYLVHVKEGSSTQVRAELESKGIQVVSYIPNNTWLVKMGEAGNESAITSIGGVETVLPFHPYFKLGAKVLESAVDHQPAPRGYLLTLTLFPGTLPAATAVLAEMNGLKIVNLSRSPFGPQLIVQSENVELVKLASENAVQSIEVLPKRALMNDLTRVVLGVSENTVTLTNYLGLTGTNVLVNVNDSGVDASHPDLAGRVTADVASNLTDAEGHGTHVAGSIASSGEHSPTNVIGSVQGANFRGKAPGAKIFVLGVDLVGGPLLTDAYLQETAATANALISNNSWGYVGANDYISASASYDAAVRDALPGVTGSQPMLYVFAAGNDGDGGNDGQGGFADTVVAPGTAKNVITVGSVESPRGITNQFVINGRTNDLFPHMTDSADQISGFSSRGPVGAGIEGDFGRFKPDVVAPGTFIVSTRSQTPAYKQADTYYSGIPNFVPGQSVPAKQTVVYPIDLPDNAVGFLVRLQPNSSTVLPMPDLAIKADKNNPPSTFKGNNEVFVDATSAGRWYFSVQNTNKQPVLYDLRTVIVVTNDVGNYFEVLKQLDEPLKPYYRFESGTSMAAPAVTGTLALMQEFFRDKMSINPSPALMKALLINGSRSLNHSYDFYHKADVVYQGWGMVNLTNSIPAGLSNVTTSPLQFVDQSPSTALATGEEYTRILTLNTNGVEQDYPLRVTLVWTDPPGNPVAGVKLVNDLDLIVTNMITGEVYSGNNFEPGSVVTLSGNSPVGDKINNVENVYLIPSGGGKYSITVRGTRVNVNAVTASLKGIAQDFALVVSTENVFTPSAYSLGAPVQGPVATTNYVAIRNGAPILNQRVGANSPLIGSLGSSNQWNFYVFTNTAGFSNVAFVTFLPPNLSTPRNSDADIDLYVSKNPALLRLDASAILGADKSTNRGGTETIIYTNAPNILNDVYYVGVKSEDQSGGEFGFFAVSDRDPFSSRDQDGNLIIRGVPASVDIPDGTPKVPGQAFIFGLTPEPDIVQRVTVTNTITHELFGDLYGVLTHANSSAVLYNHLDDPLNRFSTRTFLFDDSNSGDNLSSRTSPGPGTLQNFVGKKATGAWILNMLDNTPTHTGRVDYFSIKVEPQQTNLVDRTIQPGRYYYDFADVPLEGTNLSVTITYPGAANTQGAVDLFIREAVLPTLTEYDKTGVVNPPGGSLSLGVFDSPPLFPDLYYIGFYNPNSFPIRIRYKIKVDLNLTPVLPTAIVSTGPMVILDDAKSKSSINVTNVGRIADISVNLQLNHPRISDLSVRLVSPSGTRALLMENRGGPNTANFDGYFSDKTNNFPIPIKFAQPPFTPPAIFAGPPALAESFETAAGDIDQGGVAGTFSVLTNRVSVVSNAAEAADGSHLLALGLGTISVSLPTTNARYYSVAYASRQTDIVADWAADNNFNDVTGHGLQGVSNGVSFVTGEVRQAFSFVPGSRVSLGNPPELAFTNSFSIEGWVQLTNYTDSFILFRGDNRNSLDPYFLSTDATGRLVFHIEDAATNKAEVVTDTALSKDQWHHVASVFNKTARVLQLYVDGALVKETSSSTVVPFADLDPNPNSSAGVYIGNIPDFVLQFPGYIDELAVYKRALTAAEIFGVFKSGSAGKQVVTNGFARSQYSLEASGLQTNLFPGLSWQTNVFYFRATNSNTELKFTGSPVSVLLDNIQVTEVSFTTNYYLPEESLLVFKGEQSVGTWNLEVFDKRTGATVDTSIVSWHLDFIFPTNRAATATVVTGGTSVTNSVVGSETVYFAIDVPASASYATNTLTSIGDLQLLYNNTALPVGGPSDIIVDNSTTGGEFLLVSTNSPITEPIRPGQRYYLGVRNANPSASNNFVLTVEFDKKDTYQITTQPLVNGVLFSTNIPSGNQLQYYQYDVSTNAVAASFEIVNPDGNVDLVIGRGPFLPNSSTYAYRSSNPGLSDEIINISTNSTPVPLAPGRWYLGVYSFATNTVAYSIRVTEQPTLSSNIIDLVEGVGQTNIANPGAYFTNFYRVTITNNPSTVFFHLFNLDGNADLVAKREALPTIGDFDYRSRNFGTNDERIRVSTNSTVTNLNGIWYLGVPNSSTANVNYTIEFLSQTNSVPIIPSGGGFSTNVIFNGVATNITVGPGTVITNIYEFTIDQTNSAALFELYNLTGNVDLIVGRGSFPSTNQMLFSVNGGTLSEQIVIRTNSSSITNLNGKWYVAIPNNEEFAVSLTLRAVVSTNGMLLSGQAPQFSASSVTVDGNKIFSASYYGVLGETYAIDFTTDFVTWTTLYTISTTSVPQSFIDPAPVDSNLMRFYRLRQVPTP